MQQHYKNYVRMRKYADVRMQIARPVVVFSFPDARRICKFVQLVLTPGGIG
jgi:hypothetical protein